MKKAIARLVALFVVLFCFNLPVRSDIVFDNSTNYLTNYWSSLHEFGDEVQLTNTARVVTNFVFEYFGDFTREGDETARIRFYKNDGTITRYPGPATLLYDSGPFAIFKGLNAAPINGLAVKVPDDFTWTVQFGGLTGLPGDRAGLPYYDPVTVGFSYADYWEKIDPAGVDGHGWDLLSFANLNPPANFAARIQATDDGVRFSPGQRVANGHIQFQLSGPIGQIIVIQASTNLVNWTNVSTNTFTTASITYEDTEAQNFTVRFYRANLRQPQATVSSPSVGDAGPQSNPNYAAP